MAALPAAKFFPFVISNSAERSNKRLESRKYLTIFSFGETSASRRCIMGSGAVSLIGLLNLNSELMLLPALSEEKPNALEDKEESVVGALKTLFDPNETTKAGKVMPKAYLKSARELVKTLRKSLKEDTKDIAKFRRTTDAAKESIRDYLNGWRGQKAVVNEESYVMLEKAIRTLASFYSKAGPSATLPEEVRSEILSDLSTAEEFI